MTRRDKQVMFLLLFFSLLISAIETIGVSIIMPFISLSSDFSLIKNNKHYSFVYDFFGFESNIHFVIFFGSSLVVFYAARSVLNLFYFYELSKFSQGIYYMIVFRLFERYLGLSYTEFVKKNSSVLTKSIINEANNLSAVIQSVLFVLSEILVVIFIYSMMLYISWQITLVLTFILLLSALVMIKLISSKIRVAGSSKEILQRNFYEIINRTFGNFKLIKLSSNDRDILNEFAEASYGYARLNIKNSTLQQYPRLFLEAIGFGLIISIVTYLVYKEQQSISGIVGVLSIFVLGLYRLMPSVNRILTGYNQVMFHHKSLDIVYDDLMYEVEQLGNEAINFFNFIEMKEVSFEHERNKPILSKINLKICKGERVAFIGESGSGKSTLIDIMIGLYRQKTGEILVDNKEVTDKNINSWRNKVGYIPQSVYLFDGTVGENVAFGSDIEERRLSEVLKQAKIYDFLKTKTGMDTVVGEGGIMLSGGQKQRIAIARALYKNPDILVLDEATSALDKETERRIMDEIYEISKDKTLIIIAHRLSTVQRCDKIYEIQDGMIRLLR